MNTNIPLGEITQTSYNFGLVALSYIIAVIGSFVALTAAQRIQIRKVLQKVGLTAKQGEELAYVPQFLVSAQELAGQLHWQAGAHKLSAKLSRLNLPLSSSANEPNDTSLGRQAANLPALDITVDALSYQQQPLGHLQLAMQPRSNGWQLDQLWWSGPEGRARLTGMWQRDGREGVTALRGQFDSQDLGGLLARFGYPDTLRRGRLTAQGALQWQGGLRQFLSEHVDLRVEGEASNGREAIDLVRNHEIDVLLMDLSMPGQSGLDALAMRGVVRQVGRRPVRVAIPCGLQNVRREEPVGQHALQLRQQRLLDRHVRVDPEVLEGPGHVRDAGDVAPHEVVIARLQRTDVQDHVDLARAVFLGRPPGIFLLMKWITCS